MAAGVYSMEGDIFTHSNVTASPFSAVNATTEKAISEDLRLTRIIVRSTLIPVVAVFGVLGNVLNIVVLTRKWMCSSTNYYLTALAIYDILYLVLVIVFPVMLTDIRIVADSVVDIFSNTAIWLTVTFTIERYICVSNPMRGRVLCTPKRAKYVIAGVCIVGALVNFPVVLEPWIGECPSFKFGYKNVVQALFFYLPLMLLSVFNTLLVRNVVRASRERAAMMLGTMTSSRRARRAAEQTRVTTMLIVVVVVFLVCQLPQAVMNTLGATMETTDNLLILYNIANLLVVINSAVNFVLYSSFSGKFRRTFRHVLLRCAARFGLLSDTDTPASLPCTPMHSLTPSPAVSRRGSPVSQKSLAKNNFLQVNPNFDR